MTPRLDPFAAAPAPMKSWLDWSIGIEKSGLEASLMELVKIRAWLRPLPAHAHRRCA